MQASKRLNIIYSPSRSLFPCPMPLLCFSFPSLDKKKVIYKLKIPYITISIAVLRLFWYSKHSVSNNLKFDIILSTVASFLL